MNKLIFTLNVFILLSVLPTQSMEQENQSTLQTNVQSNSNCPLPDFKLEDELIFKCCQTQEIDPKSSLKESQKAFKDSIQNFIKMRITCKKYSESLTDEKIGNFCKNHSTFAKKQTIRDLLPLMPDREYNRFNLILSLHGLDDEQSNSSLLSRFSMLWIEKIINKNDVYMMKTLFKKQIINPNTKTIDIPLFYLAKTVEMIHLCITYEADLNATPGNPIYNVLTHIKNNHYPSELTQFYVDRGVKKLELQ